MAVTVSTPLRSAASHASRLRVSFREVIGVWLALSIADLSGATGEGWTTSQYCVNSPSGRVVLSTSETSAMRGSIVENSLKSCEQGHENYLTSRRAGIFIVAVEDTLS